jgi:Family of unknown function (DUF6220)
MRRVFAGLAVLLTLAVVAQFYFAAVGAFDSAPNDESFSIHRSLGYAILLLSVLVTVVAALARAPGRLVARAALVIGLVFVQSLIRLVADALGDGDTTTTAGVVVFGLHALNGLAILELSGTLARAARDLARESPTEAGADDGSVRVTPPA